MRKYYAWNPQLFLGTHDFFSQNPQLLSRATTHNFLPSTHNFLPTTFYQQLLATTFFSGPKTFYPKLFTQNFLTTTFYPRLFTHNFLPTTFYPRPTTFSPPLFPHDPRLLASLHMGE
jgi:hypothetical protein